MKRWNYEKKNAEFRKKTQEKVRKSYEKIAKSRVTNPSGCRRGVSTTIYISFWCISNFAGCLKNEKVLVGATILLQAVYYTSK